jgi:signal transduction histidine kinase
MRLAIDSVLAAEELETRLRLLYADEFAGHPSVTRPSASREERTHAARDIAYWIGEMRRQSQSASEVQLVDAIDQDVSEFLATLREAPAGAGDDANGSTPDAADPSADQPVHDQRRIVMSRALTRIDGLLLELVQVNVAQARDIGRGIEDRDDIVRAGGMIAAATMLLLALALIVGARRSFYRPFLALRDGIRRLGHGEHGTHVPESGPAELREIAVVFNEMAEALGRQRTTQLRFLAAVAHDLRNPLNAIRMSADLMEFDDGDKAARTQTIDIIRRQALRLDRMVGDLLDTTRIEAGQLEIRREPHDVRELANDTVQLFKAISELHQLELCMPSEPVLANCDGVRIGQVITNLIGNAIKYSPNGGIVRVTLAPLPDAVELSVEDQGIGIASDELDGIFEPFRRSPKTAAMIPGVGLGLSVARRIVEAHGGRIRVESRVGQGSTFHVWLPRSGVPQSAGAAGESAAARRPEAGSMLRPAGVST